MPYPVQNLIEGQGEPTYVNENEAVPTALSLMHRYDFSQLPVVDEVKRPLGLITHESILHTHRNFGIPVEQLSVLDAMRPVTRADTYRREDDLFDLLDRLRDTNSVLIVDGENRLTGIVTSYDANAYFRRRAEDMMLVEDIETMVKDIILTTFSDEAGELDQSELDAAIDGITSSGQSLLQDYRGALQYYFNLQHGEKQRIDEEALTQSFSRLAPPQRDRTFEKLTFNDYIELLLYEDRWDFYNRFLSIPREALRRLLTSVRDTRNALAHFRGEVTREQREQLRFCSGWLARHPAGIQVSWPVPAKESVPGREVLREEPAHYETAPQFPDVTLADEELGPGASRYAPLAIWLSNQPPDVDRVQVQFSDVEEMTGGSLPTSARQHRAWWANDPVGRIQSQQWLDAGWRVAGINMSEEQVSFARIKERETAYIDFFSALQHDLRQEAGFSVREASPRGTNWHTVVRLPEDGPKALNVAFSFAWNNRFRVELYIDSGDRRVNKAVFDWLIAERGRLEEQLGQELAWERLNHRRASRIALYHRGSITDDPDELAALRRWAAEAMVRFHAELSEEATRALARALDEDS
jgi:hypothetical protein